MKRQVAVLRAQEERRVRHLRGARRVAARREKAADSPPKLRQVCSTIDYIVVEHTSSIQYINTILYRFPNQTLSCSSETCLRYSRYWTTSSTSTACSSCAAISRCSPSISRVRSHFVSMAKLSEFPEYLY